MKHKSHTRAHGLRAAKKRKALLDDYRDKLVKGGRKGGQTSKRPPKYGKCPKGKESRRFAHQFDKANQYSDYGKRCSYCNELKAVLEAREVARRARLKS